ncbi:hypothetical protein [Oxalicibacterium solurbis]|uniref:hypothetical protein n=1 Tax=Oxalicibacterium solurbis TaxID=69280 RepID=UPI0016677D17|nr:hypothetical protein [Oxalicibacterium solurbis]
MMRHASMCVARFSFFTPRISFHRFVLHQGCMLDAAPAWKIVLDEKYIVGKVSVTAHQLHCRTAC